MKALIYFILFISVGLLAIFYSCNPKDKPMPSLCDSNPCANLEGFDCLDGQCLCPKGKFKVGDFCVELDTFHEYYGVGCPLFDTILISGVTPYVPGLIGDIAKFRYRTSGLRPQNSKRGVWSKEMFGTHSKNGTINFLLDSGRIYKIKDTVSCFVTAKGTLLQGKKLKMTFCYQSLYQNNRIIDSCQMMLYQ